MKKQGFTLLELLAVIVILTVVSLITIPIVLNYIEKSRIESYKVSVNTAIDAAKEYVAKYEKNYDFPEGGINISEVDLKLDKEKFISGIIKRDEQGIIVAENIYNGKYCANGNKNYIIVGKVESAKECKGIDITPPELKVKINNTTATTITVVAVANDSISKIQNYEYCIGDECSGEIEKNNYTFKNLKSGIEYEIKVTVKNENSGKEDYPKETTDRTVKVAGKTGIVENAKFKVSTSSYAGRKEVRIIYPEGNYEYRYEIFDLDGNQKEVKQVSQKEILLNIEENCVIKAYVKYENEEAENELYVLGIDKSGPKIVVIMNDNWEQTKQIKVIATDSVGIATKGYSYDGGKNWSNNNLRTFTENKIIKLIVRDKLGNITDSYKICKDESQTDCYEASEIVISKVDRVTPKCSLKVVSGTLGENGWYRSNVTVGFETISDIQKDAEGKDIEGSGIASQKIDKTSLTNDGKYIVKATLIDKVGNEGTCELSVNIDKMAPKCGIITLSGTLGENGWYRSNVIITKTDGTDTTSGHASTTISHTSITSETAGTTVTLTTKDKAGNVCTTTKNVKVDKTKPSCSLKVKSGIVFVSDWYQSDIEIEFGTKTDILSGIASDSIDKTKITAAGKTTVTGTIKDNAGNQSTCKYIAKKSATKTVTLSNSNCQYKGEMAYTGDKAYLGTYGYYITKSEIFELPNWATKLKIISYDYGNVQESQDWFIFSDSDNHKIDTTSDKVYTNLKGNIYFTNWTYNNAGTYCGDRKIKFRYYGD